MPYIIFFQKVIGSQGATALSRETRRNVSRNKMATAIGLMISTWDHGHEKPVMASFPGPDFWKKMI
jgi:hypothetical protein